MFRGRWMAAVAVLVEVRRQRDRRGTRRARGRRSDTPTVPSARRHCIGIVHVDDLTEAKRAAEGRRRSQRFDRAWGESLSLAIANGNAEMVDVLLRAGADASHAEPSEGETHLMLAAQVGVLAVVKQLLEARALSRGSRPRTMGKPR